MSLSEFGALRQRIREQFPGLRLYKGERDGIYTLVNIASNAIEAERLTATEIHQWLAGITSLAQLRQPAKEDR